MRSSVLLFVFLSVASACGGSAPRARLPRATAATIEKVREGDTLRVYFADDPTMNGDIVVGPRGTLSFGPHCGRSLAGLTTGEAERAVAACLVEAGVYVEAPRVTVIVKRGTFATLIAGPARTRRAVPPLVGITVTGALAEGLVIPRGAMPRRVTVTRGSSKYVVDVAPILEGEQPDEPLEPGDVITVDEDLGLRPPLPAEPSRRVLGAAPPVEKASCGELLLDEAELLAIGAGERHPRLVHIREAMAGGCAGDSAASLREACARAQQERLVALGDLGPRHPRLRALEAKVAICPPPVPLPPRAAPDCAALRAKRAALVAEGKGERHPLVVAVSAELDACR